MADSVWAVKSSHLRTTTAVFDRRICHSPSRTWYCVRYYPMRGRKWQCIINADQDTPLGILILVKDDETNVDGRWHLHQTRCPVSWTHTKTIMLSIVTHSIIWFHFISLYLFISSLVTVVVDGHLVTHSRSGIFLRLCCIGMRRTKRSIHSIGCMRRTEATCICQWYRCSSSKPSMK